MNQDLSRATVDAEDFTITIKGAQLRALSHACEMAARTAAGQLDVALESCLDRQGRPCVSHRVVNQIEDVVKPLMGLASGGSWSVGMHESSDVHWDLYQVFRSALAWQEAKARGEVAPDFDSLDPTQLRSTQFQQVFYDVPRRYSSQPLARVATSSVARSASDVDAESQGRPQCR